jgi:hypothetical protein
MVAPEFLRALVFVSVFVIIAPGFLRAAVSVSVSEIVAGRGRAAVSVSVSVSEIVAGRLRAAISVSVSEIVAGRLRAAVSVLVIIAPGFLRAAVSVLESIISAKGWLAVGIGSPFKNCSHGHFSRLRGEGRSLLRRVYSASVGTGLAFKAGRGWL